MANLMLHAGAQPCTFQDLKGQDDPVAKSKTHMPIRNDAFMDLIFDSLEKNGEIEVTHEEYGLTKDGANMFEVLGIRGLNPQGDYETMLAARNSNRWDFSASLGFSTRVFVCDNMAFSVDDPISRKHTAHIWRDLRKGIDEKGGFGAAGRALLWASKRGHDAARIARLGDGGHFHGWYGAMRR